MVVELVAKPMEQIKASSMPTNLATRASPMVCRSVVPPSRRELREEMPYRLIDSSTASAQPPRACANPR